MIILKKYILFLFLFQIGCTTVTYKNTVERVELHKFMGTWYVLAGRFTSFEEGAHNAVEKYTWNEVKQRIDIDFTYKKNSFDGPLKSIPQKAWIENKNTNAYWKVSPFWPLKFDYLVVDLSQDYSWTAIGVPDEKYLWIMARDWKNAESTVQKAIKSLNQKGYSTQNIVTVPHHW